MAPHNRTILREEDGELDMMSSERPLLGLLQEGRKRDASYSCPFGGFRGPGDVSRRMSQHRQFVVGLELGIQPQECDRRFGHGRQSAAPFGQRDSVVGARQ